LRLLIPNAPVPRDAFARGEEENDLPGTHP
jgi:hypothetical protein